MEDEISITVQAPGTAKRTYVFDEHPVEIGRSPDCHVAICHEAVPRRLCSAWLEDGGGGVRVEERPGLTNPLMRGTNPVKGGLGGERLDLSVGPVEISIAPAGAGDEDRQERPGLARRIKVGIAAALLVGATALALLPTGGDDPSSDRPLPGLPETPLPPPPDDLRGAGGADRARLVYTRARSILEAGEPDPRSLVEAALLIRRSALITSAAGDSAGAEKIQEEWKALADSIEQRYRREVVDLRRHLALGDGDSASRSAAVVAALLEGAGREIPSDLEDLLEPGKAGPR